MLNCSALLLRLAHPFVRGRLQGAAKFQDLFTQHLDPSYFTTQARRLGSASSTASLSGQRGVASGAAAAAALVPWYGGQLLAAEEAGVPSFMADVFFVAQRHLHVGLLPAVARWEEGGCGGGHYVVGEVGSLWRRCCEGGRGGGWDRHACAWLVMMHWWW
jgi:hypothetical protein